MDKQSTDEAKAGVNKVPPQVEQDRDKTIAPQNMEQIISRENSRRQLFEYAIYVALGSIIVLYGLFICFVVFCYRSNSTTDWHIALMIVLPATTILLSIVHALKYKDPNDKPDEGISIPQVKELVETLKPIKELFTLKSNDEK